MDQRALIAMSGGVDSSVAAYLTLLEGFSCLGATMLLEHAGADTQDARSVAQRLGMEFHVLDFTRQFRQQVMEDFAASYQQGLTPNPCVVCNRWLKFGALLEAARDLGCSWLVTGHYARICQRDGRYLLQKAVDASKDQTYFLYALTQQQLSHIRFPLGGLTKEQTRQVALEQGFSNAEKRDSQDICFIPGGDYFAFLQRFTGIPSPPGSFLDLEGQVVGQHRGAAAYTLGQRKGLGLAMGEPVYVCGKDMEKNTVTVGPNEALYSRALRARDWFFHPFDELKAPMAVTAKARSRMAEVPATVYPEGDGFCRVEFQQPQRALTPGQAIVLYDGDTVLGGGTITQTI